MSKTIDLIYFNAGGGHRAAASALESVMRQRHPGWTVRCVDLFQVLDARGRFRDVFGAGPEAYYNQRLARGWTLGLAQELKVLQAFIRLAHGPMARILEQHWLRTEPDLVVSLVPNFNRLMRLSLGAALPGVPYVTVLTDLADFPPHFWIEPDLDQHIVCGTEQALRQARAAGYPDERLHLTSGMILRPDFYRAPTGDRSLERQSIGLDPQRPTGLVLFGGHGARGMEAIARQLDDVQLILLCGHNAALADDIRALPSRAPRAVVGFTPDVARYMRMADFFIGKPGPGSLSEAVHLGLPVVTVRNAWTLPQERYNADWVREQGLGLVAPSMRRIREPVLQLLDHLDTHRAAARRLNNRAVFEVPEIIAGVLRLSGSAAASWLPHASTAPLPTGTGSTEGSHAGVHRHDAVRP